MTVDPPAPIDDLPLLGGHLHHAVERDGIRRRELVTRDRVGLPQELPDLGEAGLPALLALVQASSSYRGRPYMVAVNGFSSANADENVGQVTW